MRLVFGIVFAAIFATIGFAQPIPAPKGYADTLNLMYDFLIDNPDINRLELTDDDGLEVFVGEDGQSMILYPDNLTSYLQTAESDADRRVVFDAHMNTMLDNLAQTLSDAPREFTLAQIMPVLRHESYASSLTDDISLLTSDFPGELSVFLVADYPDQVEYLTQKHLDDAGFSEEDVRAAAAENIRARFDQISVESNEEAGISWILLDGYYESSLVLATEIWANVAPEYGELIMIVPNRDYLVFGDGRDKQVRDILEQFATDVDQQFNGALTDEIYRWTDKGWVVD